MTSGIHISGIPKFDESILAMTALVEDAALRIVTKGGLMIASESKRSFLTRPSGSQRTAKSGRVYYSFKPPYQAQPPRATNRSGNLSRSIKIQATTKVPGGWRSATGPSMFYAPFVEYGTSKMKPEPFLEFALNKNLPRISELARLEWDKAVH